MNLDAFTIVSYDEFMGFDRSTGSLEMILDELSEFTLSQEEEKTDITGKGGRTIGSMKKNKKVTGSGTNGMLSGGALATMTGSEVEDGTFNIRYTDVIVVNGDAGTTKETALGTVGNEIGTIYIRDANKALLTGGRKLTQVAGAPKTGEFQYNAGTKELTFFADDIADGTEVYAYYDANVTGKRISNKSDKYSKTLEGYLNVTCTDGCDNLFYGQFIIPRADFNGTFDIAGGTDPATLSFEFSSLPDLCTGKSDLWDFVIFE